MNRLVAAEAVVSFWTWVPVGVACVLGVRSSVVEVHPGGVLSLLPIGFLLACVVAVSFVVCLCPLAITWCFRNQVSHLYRCLGSGVADVFS